MITCLQCGEELKGKYAKKFCNRVCSGTYNSSRRKVNPEWFSNLRKETVCKECGAKISGSYTNQKYCSDKCKEIASSKRIQKRLENAECKSIGASAPFDDLRLYITTSSDNRKKAFLYAMDRKELRYSMSYARYLMCIHLGRVLEKEEHVDHINNNPLDDRIENLQILSQKENTQKFNKEVRKGRNMVEMICVCGNVFTRDRRNTHLTPSRKSTNTYCSRKCIGTSEASLKESKTVVIREFKEFS